MPSSWSVAAISWWSLSPQRLYNSNRCISPSVFPSATCSGRFRSSASPWDHVSTVAASPRHACGWDGLVLRVNTSDSAWTTSSCSCGSINSSSLRVASSMLWAAAAQSGHNGESTGKFPGHYCLVAPVPLHLRLLAKVAGNEGFPVQNFELDAASHISSHLFIWVHHCLSDLLKFFRNLLDWNFHGQLQRDQSTAIEAKEVHSLKWLSSGPHAAKLNDKSVQNSVCLCA